MNIEKIAAAHRSSTLAEIAKIIAAIPANDRPRIGKSRSIKAVTGEIRKVADAQSALARARAKARATDSAVSPRDRLDAIRASRYLEFALENFRFDEPPKIIVDRSGKGPGVVQTRQRDYDYYPRSCRWSKSTCTTTITIAPIAEHSEGEIGTYLILRQGRGYNLRVEAIK